jgi:hypothetical protein
MSGAIPPILTLTRPPEPPAAVAAGLVAAKVRPVALDRVELSPAARSDATLSPFRSPADRNEAATGVARGRLIDRRA